MALTKAEFNAQLVDPAQATLAEAELVLSSAEASLVLARVTKQDAEKARNDAREILRALRAVRDLLYPQTSP